MVSGGTSKFSVCTQSQSFGSATMIAWLFIQSRTLSLYHAFENKDGE
jgi:hypothetical protein